MKKLNLVLCLIACVFSLTACGSKEVKTLSPEREQAVQSMSAQVIQNVFSQMDAASVQQFKEAGAEYAEYVFESAFSMKVDGNGMIGSFESWNSAQEDLGTLVSVDGYEMEYDGKKVEVVVSVTGSKKPAKIEFIYKDDLYMTLESVTTNVEYTFAEKMEKAGLNTLLGMGTVFVVLILISLIISCFGFIPKAQTYFDNKKKKKSSMAAEAVDNTIAQIIEKEELTDDTELVAVITAAIAASGTAGASTDGFVVRSIKRVKTNKWQRA